MNTGTVVRRRGSPRSAAVARNEPLPDIGFVSVTTPVLYTRSTLINKISPRTLYAITVSFQDINRKKKINRKISGTTLYVYSLAKRWSFRKIHTTGIIFHEKARFTIKYLRTTFRLSGKICHDFGKPRNRVQSQQHISTLHKY